MKPLRKRDGWIRDAMENTGAMSWGEADGVGRNGLLASAGADGR